MTKDGNIQELLLPNGLMLLGEEIPASSAISLSLLVPIGAASDPEEEQGAASLLCEMLHKGAGEWDARSLSAQFDALGAQRSQAAGVEVSLFSAALLAQNVNALIKLYGAFLLKPWLPPEELESVRQLAFQDLNSLEDEPASKVMVELARNYYPSPFGRCHLGTTAGVAAITPQSLRHYYQSHFQPARSVLAVAGAFQWPKLRALIEDTFSSWSGSVEPLQCPALRTEARQEHLPNSSNQMQIALAYPSVSLDSPDYYTAKLAVGVLSGGMAGRLFVEVREKRGLVYRVSASHSAAKGRAGVFVYAGTTPDKAQETLKVILEELHKLREGVSDEELQRAKADLKARLVMQSEITSYRASQLVNDWWHIGRVRSIEEIKAAIDAVSSADIERHVAAYPAWPHTLVTLGPQELEQL